MAKLNKLPCKDTLAKQMFDENISYVDYCQLLCNAIVGVDYQPKRNAGAFDFERALSYWIGLRLYHNLSTAPFKAKKDYTFYGKDSASRIVRLVPGFVKSLAIKHGLGEAEDFNRDIYKKKINTLIRNPELRNNANNAIDEAKTKYDVEEIVRLAVIETLKKQA